MRGATFMGVVTGGYEVSPIRASYRLRVARRYAGDFGSHVRLSVQCVDTRFKVGARLLISSGRAIEKDGGIARVVFDDYIAVAWRVRDGDVFLRSYGDGFDDAPYWATRPETVRQAVRAVVAD